MSDKIFAGRPFWVTGAASGLGAAVVQAAQQCGARVMALDVDDSGGQALADRTGAQYAHCDVSSLQEWQQLGAQFAQALAAADAEQGQAGPAFIHLNAGIQIAPNDAPLSDYQLDAMTEARYRLMMGVNVDGVVFGLHSLLPLLPDNSAVVVTCSLAGVTPYAIDPLYAMSKHAVTGLVRSLAPTLRERNIRLNAICPGGIDTAIIPLEQRTADAAFMTPEHVAQDVLGLLQTNESGKTWAKVAQGKPPFIIRAPGDKKPS